MNKMVRWAVAIAVAAFLTGCGAAPKLALSKADTTVDVSTKSLVLMTLRVDHAYKPAVTPYPTMVILKDNPAKDRWAYESGYIDAEAGAIGPDGKDYLIRIAVPPGKYTASRIIGGGGFAIFTGNFIIPLNSDIEVKPGTVSYLGRVEAVTRERVGEEFRAGPVIPLIDQAASGWSGSTWDVKIRDAYDADMLRFKTVFPALRTVTVQKNVLVFDRAKAQKDWEDSW